MAGILSSIGNMLGGGQGQQQGGRLRVTVVEARNLARKDILNKSDPYCILSVHSKHDLSFFGDKQQTTVINNNQNPYWNQTFYLNVKNPQSEMLKVHCYDKDPIRDDEIGTVDIPLFDLVNGQPRDGWHQLYPSSGGAVHLVICAEGFGAQGGFQQQGYAPQMGMGMGQPQYGGFQQSGGFPQQGFQQQGGFPQQGFPAQQGYGYGGAPAGYPPQGGYY